MRKERAAAAIELMEEIKNRVKSLRLSFIRRGLQDEDARRMRERDGRKSLKGGAGYPRRRARRGRDEERAEE